MELVKKNALFLPVMVFPSDNILAVSSILIDYFTKEIDRAAQEINMFKAVGAVSSLIGAYFFTSAINDIRN